MVTIKVNSLADCSRKFYPNHIRLPPSKCVFPRYLYACPRVPQKSLVEVMNKSIAQIETKAAHSNILWSIQPISGRLILVGSSLYSAVHPTGAHYALPAPLSSSSVRPSLSLSHFFMSHDHTLTLWRSHIFISFGNFCAHAWHFRSIN